MTAFGCTGGRKRPASATSCSMPPALRWSSGRGGRRRNRIDGELMLRTLYGLFAGRAASGPGSSGSRAWKRGCPAREWRTGSSGQGKETAHANRIKALLRLLGVAVGNPRRKRLSFLEQQRDWQGQPTTVSLVGRSQARARAPDHGTRGYCGVGTGTGCTGLSHSCSDVAAIELQRLKALGPAFTATLVNELFYKDFRNACVRSPAIAD